MPLDELLSVAVAQEGGERAEEVTAGDEERRVSTPGRTLSFQQQEVQTRQGLQSLLMLRAFQKGNSPAPGLLVQHLLTVTTGDGETNG